VFRKDPNLLRTQCSKAFDRMGLIAIPLKSLQAKDLLKESLDFGSGTI